MWPRFHLNDVRVVGHSLGTLVLLTGVVMLIPFFVALLAGEKSPATDFLIGIGACMCIGSALRLLKARPGKLNRRQALLVTGFSWIVIALVAAIPLVCSGRFLSPIDAVFDSVSVLTTTGMTVATDYDHLSYSHWVWRVLLNLIGGQGVIVVALSLGFFGRSGGAAGSIYKAEGRTDHVLPNIIQTTRFIWIVSGGVILAGSIIGTLVSLSIGISPLRSLMNGFSLTVSSYDTGGITPYSSSLIYYHSPSVELFCLIFMLLGIINYTLFAGLLSGKFKKIYDNLEIKTVIIWFLCLTAAMAIVLMGDGVFTGIAELLRRGLFMVVSAGTTAGLLTVYGSQLGLAFSGGAMVLLILLMLIGGTSGSTAGGIKAVRLGIIVKWFWATIKRMIMPESAKVRFTYHQFGTQELTSEVATQAMIIFVLYVITAAAGGMLGIFAGYDAIPAMFESVACVTNNGISAGIISPGIPLYLKLFYILQMWAGRLEFIALLAVIAGMIYSILSLKNKPVEL